MLDSNALRWQFWLLLVLASAFGGALIAAVARAAAYSVGYTVGGSGGVVLGEAALGTVALGGFMGGMGVSHWLVMLRHFSWAGRWLLANAAGGSVAGAVMLGLFAALGPMGPTLSAVLGVVAGLAMFGITQWLVLRRVVSWAGTLALVSVVGLIAAMMLGGGVIGAVVGSELGSGGGFGAVYGAITGGALVTLDTRTARTAMAPQSAT